MKAWLTLWLAVFVTAPWTASALEPRSPATPATPAANPSARPAVFIPGRVSRSLFTRAILNREPVDTVSVLGNDNTRIVYFTEIRGMSGQTITHRWEYNGKVIMEVPIKIKTTRWRAYSVKTLNPAWAGEWKASVVDAAGGSLSVNTFSYMKNSGTAAR